MSENNVSTGSHVKFDFTRTSPSIINIEKRRIHLNLWGYSPFLLEFHQLKSKWKILSPVKFEIEDFLKRGVPSLEFKWVLNAGLNITIKHTVPGIVEHCQLTTYQAGSVFRTRTRKEGHQIWGISLLTNELCSTSFQCRVGILSCTYYGR